jgi:acetyl esterase/lipase
LFRDGNCAKIAEGLPAARWPSHDRRTAMDAKTSETRIHEFDVEDVEYLRHGGEPLLATIFTPKGDGPFPALVECHGGAWCQSNRQTERIRHQFMASHGIISIALDFRSGNTDPYPASVQDINYAVRWTKHNARKLKTRPDLIGLSGQSSGGHLAMLVAMRPNDRRYTAIPLPAGATGQDASVRGVIMSWPVINPLSRYRMAKREGAKPNPPAWPPDIIRRHDSYWQSEANMEEGNPTLILERGEKVSTPPALWFQAQGDFMHDYRDEATSQRENEPQRFVAAYRKAGGEIDLIYFDGPRQPGHSPDLSKMGDNFERMVTFVGMHMKG